ncbi:MAG: toxin-antitoxin system YwqK family antitoxin [Cetobacterium sp.]
MKKLGALLFLSMLFISCGKEKIINQSMLQQRKNIVYEVNQKKPFTGIGLSNNGIFTVKTKYKKGLKEEELQFYKSGQASKVVKYKNGLKEGKETSYYSNGELQKVTTYEKGLKSGIEAIYNSEGLVLENTVYKADKILERTVHDIFTGKKKISVINEEIKFRQADKEIFLNQIILNYDANENINSITAGHSQYYIYKNYLGYSYENGIWYAFLKYENLENDAHNLEKAVITVNPEVINVENTKKIVESLKKITTEKFWDNWDN